MPTSHYPLSPEAELKQSLVGHSIRSLPIPAPSLILDRAKVQRNCDAMLDVCRALDVGFRAHVKSHKTLQLAKLQVGGAKEEREGGRPAAFIVSTVLEAEQLVGYVGECLKMGRKASILYGVPPAPSSLPHLLSLATNLPDNTINILLDNLAPLTHLLSLTSTSSTLTIGIFVKIDTGYHRAGIHPSSPTFLPLITSILTAQDQKKGCTLQGLYSHYGHSYSGTSPHDAQTGLTAEFNGLSSAAETIKSSLPAHLTTPFTSNQQKLILTVGATPTATSPIPTLTSATAQTPLTTLLTTLKPHYTPELHAGVYPLLDLQQLATHAHSNLTLSSLALTVLAEITSAYPSHTPGRSNARPERLISAGSLALGREVCRAYEGWGVVSAGLGNAGREVFDFSADGEEGKRKGWVVGRVSQEHGVLVWYGGSSSSSSEEEEGRKGEAGQHGKKGEEDEEAGLQVGDRILIYPNHACVAGAGFAWYVVVDSDLEDGGEVVVDVWTRWRGW